MPQIAVDAPLLPLFDPNPILDELRLLIPDKMTPLEALETLLRWKKSI